ncbi:MAG: FAD-dependent oxidoreductase [Pseudomonadota bacterium]
MSLANDYPGAEFDSITRGLLLPEDYENPSPKPRYHVAVIGAGPAGLITSIAAAGLGANVALIERHRMGGDCLNVGCVPSKCLLEFSKHNPGDFDGAFEHLRKVISEIAPHDSVERYSNEGVDVFLGEAGFSEGGELVVDGKTINARKTVICTGARADIPPIPGLADAAPLTNETVFDLKEKPGSLGILGAGAIGCELALAFTRMGVEVHLFELAPRVLPLEPEFASDALAESLISAGVTLHLGQGVSNVTTNGSEEATITAGDSQVQVNKIMVALGRRPNTESLNLGVVGVGVDERGFISTDAKLRTANKKIYAAGDCTAQLQFTHHADAQARAVVQNTLFAPTAKVDTLVVPHCTYTTPEVASVGQLPDELNAKGLAFDEVSFEFAELDRGRTEIDGGGRAVVYLAAGSDKILGACIVGHDAGEQIATICLLMSNKMGLSAVGSTLFSYPTRSEFLKRLSDAYNRTRLTPRAASLLARWFKFTA